MTETTQRRPIDEIRHTLNQMGGQFKAVMPTQAHVDRFIRVVMTAVQSNPDLIDPETDRQSFYAACMRCAQEGLLPDGKQAVLKIYNTNVGTKAAPKWKKLVAYEPMTDGMLIKLRNSGEVVGAPRVHAVYEKDIFDYELGDNERITHKPFIGVRGKVIAAYSIVTLKSGETSREVMGVDEIEGIRKRSKQPDSGSWASDYGEMCRKTVFKRHCKRLPRSTDLDNMINADNKQNGLAEAVAPAATAATPPEQPAAPNAAKAAGKRRPAALEHIAGEKLEGVVGADKQPVTVEGEAKREPAAGHDPDII